MWVKEELGNVITLVWKVNKEDTIEHPLEIISPELYRTLTRRFNKPKGVIKNSVTYHWKTGEKIL